jgi:hypothetical protein
MNRHLHAAVRLHRYLVDTHWRPEGLIGPDPGIRFNYRIGRFVKSYLGGAVWKDDLYYLQAQGYWVLGNWLLFRRLGTEACRDIAVRCSATMLDRQRADGAWDYPNPEWNGRVATAEGTWGSLGLLETYRHTNDRQFLDGALRWHRFLVEEIGFRRTGDELAVNYFANLGRTRIPNNSTFVLRFLAELADLTGDREYCRPCSGMLALLRNVQRENGEFPYRVPEPDCRAGIHFQCYQYNAFQCLDLARYYELEPDPAVPPLVTRLGQFLRGGLSPAGYAFYQCGSRRRRVTYHTAVLAAAYRAAGRFDRDGYREVADRACEWLLERQRPDGGFPYSQADYRVLSDRRSYPRYLAMILLHLLMQDATPGNEPCRKDDAPLTSRQE